MCGFAGFLTWNADGLDDPECVATRMALAVQQHRGPDDAGAGVKKIYSTQQVAPKLIKLLKTVSER